MNGAVIVKSDNSIYGQEELDELAAQSFPVVGKVIWYGRRILYFLNLNGWAELCEC